MAEEKQDDSVELIRSAAHFLIGAFLSLEEGLRWQAARLLIRWNELVLKGEDDQSPGAIALKKNLDEFLEKIRQTNAGSNADQ